MGGIIARQTKYRDRATQEPNPQRIPTSQSFTARPFPLQEHSDSYPAIPLPNASASTPQLPDVKDESMLEQNPSPSLSLPLPESFSSPITLLQKISTSPQKQKRDIASHVIQPVYAQLLSEIAHHNGLCDDSLILLRIQDALKSASFIADGHLGEAAEEDSHHFFLPLCHTKLGHQAVLMILSQVSQQKCPLTLCLQGNGLTMAAFQQHKSGWWLTVTKLDLGYNPIGSRGVRRVVRALSENNVIKYLGMSFIHATDSSVKSLTRLVQNHPALLVLTLDGNLLQKAAVSSIVSAMQSCASSSLCMVTFVGCPGLDSATNRRVQEIITRNKQRLGIHSASFHFHTHSPSSSLDTSNLHVHPEALILIDKMPKNKTWKIDGSLRIGCSDTIGRRREMEDVIVICENFRDRRGDYFVGIFDGHGGCDAVNFVAENILQVLASHLQKKELKSDPLKAMHKAISEIHSRMKSFVFSGTTLVILLIIGSQLYIANVGDSRAVLCRGGEAIRLTKDHKPAFPEERKRITESGGFVDNGRLNGHLGLSRALGDSFHWPQLSGEPYLARMSLQLAGECSHVEFEAATEENNLSRPSTKECQNDDADSQLSPVLDGENLGGSGGLLDLNSGTFDEFIIIGCDGLWDVISDEQAVDVVRNLNYWEFPELAAQTLRNISFANGSNDNISVLVVPLCYWDTHRS